MKLDRHIVATLLGCELRMLLRDRRTVVMSVVLPLVVMPIMLFAGEWVNRARERTLVEKPARVAVAGSHADAARQWLARVQAGGAGAEKLPPLEFVAVKAPARALEKDEVDLIVEGLSADEARRETKAPAHDARGDATPVSPAANGDAKVTSPGSRDGRRGPGVDTEAPVDGAPVLRLVFRADRDTSQHAAHRIAAALRAARARQRDVLLEQASFPVKPDAVAAVTEGNLATSGQQAGLTLGRTLTVLLLLFLFSGGSVVATDALAGEKERGTLETLLTTAAGRVEIVAAKLLAVLAVALVITAIQAANFLVYVGFKLIPTSGNMAAAVPPPVALLLFVLYLPLALLVSGVLLLTSGFARGYKEAQLKFFPVMIVGLLPALAPFLPGLPLRSAIVVVPVANIAVAVKEVLTGTFDWAMLVVAWAVTAAAGVWVARLVVRTLTTERLITAADVDAADLAGGPALFPRRVLRAFALAWVAVLLLANLAGEGADLRLQLAVNLLGIFLGGSLLLIRAYRLDPRAALAWRAPHPAVWLAVAIGAPAGLVTGIGVFRLANLVVPVPPAMLRAFTEQLLPGDVPFWQLMLLLTVLPGVCEEIAFRGVLLYGLHRRLRPVPLALAVGLVFGLFHFTLFRIAPTAFLGVLLAALTMLSGSIFPAMAWHAVNNALGVGAGELGFDMPELPVSVHLAAAAILALAFWIVWRVRRPYPGLRPWRDAAGGE